MDLVNRFGYHGGFDRLAERFSSEKLSTLNVPLIHALVRPFGQCYDVLTPKTIRTYLLPIVENVPVFLANLKDDELKKEAKNESKNDSVSAIIKSLKSLASVAVAHPGKRISFILFSGNHLYFKNFNITVQFIHLDILVFIRFCGLILAVTVNNEYRVKVFSIERVNDIGPLAEFIVMSG